MIEDTQAKNNLRLIRLYYFLWIGAGGFLAPFVTLFYKSRGLSGTEIGLLSTFGAVTGMLAAPVWGHRGDASRHPRRLIMLALLASATFSLLRGIQSLFWTIAIFIVADALFGSGAGSLSNMQAVQAANGEKSGYGSIRLWGSLGWAVATPLAGWLIERQGLYVPFAGYAVMIAAAVVVIFFVRGESTPRAGALAARPPLRVMLKTLVGSRAMIGAALAFTVIWLATAGRGQFETLYMTRLGAPPGLIGLANTVSALFEVPFMLLADRLIRRMGAGRVMKNSMLLQAAAFLPVVLAPSIPSFFLLRIMASVALSFNVPAYYHYLVDSAPEGQGGTVISLFDVTLRSGVGLIAAPLAGVVYDLAGPYWLYVAGLAGGVIGWTILQALRGRNMRDKDSTRIVRMNE